MKTHFNLRRKDSPILLGKLQAALVEVGPLLASRPQLLPARYTGFVVADNSVYKPIRDAGLATGKLAPKR